MKTKTREQRRRFRRNVLEGIAFFLIVVLGTCGGLFLAAAASEWRAQQAEPTQDLPPQIADPAPVSNGMEVLGEFTLTAYCPCAEVCCGKWGVDRPLDENGEPIVYTASGAVAEAGVTVAVDPDVIPLGSKVYIDGLGWYEAQDTGNFSGKVIDVYFEDHAAACEFGRQAAMVSVRVEE